MDNDLWMWFDFGDADLESAEHLLTMHRLRLEIICYHCQQAVEKYLKGFLYYHGILPPKIHELDKLCHMCAEVDVRFEAIYDECEALSDYSIQPRYPHEMYLEERHMKKALEYARKIKEFAPLQEVREMLNGLK